MHGQPHIRFIESVLGRSRWPWGLRRGCAAVRLLGIAGSNSAWGHGCLSFAGVVFCQVEVSADHSSRGVLPNVVCPNDCDREALLMARPRPTRGCCVKVKKYVGSTVQ